MLKTRPEIIQRYALNHPFADNAEIIRSIIDEQGDAAIIRKSSKKNLNRFFGNIHLRRLFIIVANSGLLRLKKCAASLV